MARNRRKQLRDFLSEHPRCIFCGGQTPASERDHVPSRQLFFQKTWPEGYEFPACRSCNSATSREEQVVAMLARTYPDAVSEQDAEDTQRLIGAVARNWPDILVEMQASPRQIRNFFKKRGERKPLDVATSQLPLLSVNGPIVRSCMEKFSRKLITALHYKHTGRIIPLEGGIAWQWYSSVQALNGELPHGFIKLLGGEPKIHRTGKSLNDQFDYVYGVTDDASVAGYFATFRSSFAVLGYVVPDVTQLPGVVPSREVLRPLTAPMSA